MALLAAFGISLSIIAFAAVLGSERGRHEQALKFMAAGRVAAVQAEMDSNIAFQSKAVDRISAVHASFGSDVSTMIETLSRIASQPADPVSQAAAGKTTPALLTLEWVSLVTAEERESFEAAGPLKHLRLPLAGPYSNDEASLGFDLEFDSAAFAAMKDARNSGEPVATQRINLVQEAAIQPGFLLFMPVYQAGSMLTTSRERNDALIGFIAGVFRISDLVSSAWQHAGLQPLTGDSEFFLFDRSAQEGSQALLTPLGEPDTGSAISGRSAFTGYLSIGGRTWEAIVSTPKLSLLSIWQPWSALLAGFSITIVVIAYLLLAMQRESKTQLLVEQRTRELSEANRRLEEEIVDRSKAQRELAGLYEISRILSAEGDFKTKATEALEKLAVLANADWVTLRMPKDEEPGLHLVAASGPAVAGHAPVQIFTDAMTLSARAFADGEMIVIDDYADQVTASQTLVDLGMQSMVILPVKSREHTVGLVTVISRDKDHFGPELVEFLAAVGDGIGVLLDNSMLHEETQRAYLELQSLDKMKDELISTVSHELRTPLTSIKGAAEILLTYGDEDPEIRSEFLGMINTESDRLTRLINDLLDLAQMGSGEADWHISQVDLPSVIDTAVDSTHAITVQKNVTVEIGPSDGLPAVDSDPDKLVQIITNLLSNAIKFTPSGGLIQVRSRLLPGPDPAAGTRMAEISVSDNGVGIPKAEQKKIFDRFQQAGTSLSDRPKGTGLGLAICKEIVSHLGGEIWVESEPGKGSTFFFTVPVTKSPA